MIPKAINAPAANIDINNTYLNVFSNLCEDRINPRGKHLGFWEGSSTWEFENKSMLTISFSNQSSVRLIFQIFSKNGYLHITDEGDHAKIIVFKRDVNEIKNDSRITRTGVPILDKKVSIEKYDLSKTVSKMLIALKDSCKYFDVERETLATKCMIGSLIANKDKLFTLLPISKENKNYSFKWPIS